MNKQSEKSNILTKEELKSMLSKKYSWGASDIKGEVKKANQKNGR